MKRMVSLHN